MKGLFLAWGLLGAAPAWACTQIGPAIFAPYVSSDNTVPPSSPTLTDPKTYRYRNVGPGWGAGCIPFGSVSFAIDTEDDETPPEAIGYRMEYVEGELPDGMSIDPEKAFLAMADGRLLLQWDDGFSRKQEPFDFTFLVYAVDEAGNESEPTEAHAADPGRGVTCDVNGGAGSIGVALLASLLIRHPSSRPRRLSPVQEDQRRGLAAGPSAGR